MKKGFTLIELLAVIVVLAIIALISTPMVLNIIDTAKEGAAKSSGYAYISSVETQLATYMLKNNGNSYAKGKYSVENLKTNLDVKLKGTEPTVGNVCIGSDGTITKASLKISDYVVNYDGNKATNTDLEEIEDISCDDNSSNSCSYEVGYVWPFSYSGNSEQFTVPCNGTYKLEVYGAQGGNASVSGGSAAGGQGGYSYGNVNLTSDSILNVVVGSKGADSSSTAGIFAGGYNGGGDGYSSTTQRIGAGGGGATHIAIGSTGRGELKNYNDYKSEVLIVAGGGGGAVIRYYTDNSLSNACAGGTGGGTAGGSSAETIGGIYATGGTQENGYSFGLGASGQNSGAVCNGGGGGGYYGGNSTHSSSPTQELSGGGGSGYIGGVTDGTTENGVRTGNGYAQITLVSLTN